MTNKIKYSKNIANLLYELNCSIAVTTYQANKLVIIGTLDGETLYYLEKEFNKPMGLCLNDELFAVATKDSVETFKKIVDKKSINALYHKVTYHTGDLDIHDLHIQGTKIWFVNTKFSCVSSINEHFNFKLEWKPYFIKKLTPRDHCHINGMTLEDSYPKYITALGDKDIPYSWHESIVNGGILMDVPNNAIILKNLPMPHSPRIFSNRLYMLLSATGEIVEVNLDSQEYSVIFNTHSFIRGLDIYKNSLFIGVSKQRKDKSVFKELPIAKNTKMCGIKIITTSGNFIGEIEFLNDIEELFDIHIIKNSNKFEFYDKNHNNFLLQESSGKYFKNLKNKYYD